MSFDDFISGDGGEFETSQLFTAEDLNAFAELSTSSHHLVVTNQTSQLDWRGRTISGRVTFRDNTFNVAVLAESVFRSRVEFRTCRFHASNFESVRFEGDVGFHQSDFTRPVILTNAYFGGAADFYRVTFKDSVAISGVFIGGADFVRSRFLWDDADRPPPEARIQAQFEQGVDFTLSAFGRPVTFDTSQFSGDCRFDQSTFAGDASFRGIVVVPSRDDRAALHFHRGRFGGQADFTDARIEGDLCVRAQEIVGDMSFAQTSGSGRIIIEAPRATPPNLTCGSTETTLVATVLKDPLTISVHPSHGNTSLAGIVDSTLIAPVTITEHAPLTRCSFKGTTGLSQLRIRGDAEWPLTTGRRARRRLLPDEQNDPTDPALEGLYRQLRAALESSGAHADANDFYYGEMEARRRAAHRSRPAAASMPRRAWSRLSWPGWWPLAAYRAIGGYGVRAWRPATVYLAVVTVIGLIFHRWTDHLIEPAISPTTSPTPGSVPNVSVPTIDVSSVAEAIAYSLQNSTNLFRANDVGLSPGGVALLVAGRFAAVTLLTLTVLAVRNNVRR